MNNIYLGILSLVNFVVEPLELLLLNFGFDTYIIKVGFGSIEWFSIPLDRIIIFVFVFIVWYIFIRFVYRLFKKLFSFITGGFL
ncbi:MAG: hypothetical protein QXN68_05695 [Thermoplasmata archaeon]